MNIKITILYRGSIIIEYNEYNEWSYVDYSIMLGLHCIVYIYIYIFFKLDMIVIFGLEFSMNQIGAAPSPEALRQYYNNFGLSRSHGKIRAL